MSITTKLDVLKLKNKQGKWTFRILKKQGLIVVTNVGEYFSHPKK